MADDQESNDFIVVNDGEPRIGPHGEDLSSPPPTESKSPEAAPPTRPRGPGRPTRRSDFNDTLDPLRALPELRPIPWYEGKELPAEKSVDSTRVQTRGACLLASRGRVIDPPCTHCQNGVGRFSQCIALDDWFHGACATCQLATRGNLCSLRKDKEVSVKAESEQQESPSAEMAPPKNGSRRKRPESSSTPAAQLRDSTEELSQNEPRGSAPTPSNAARPASGNSIVPPQDAPRPSTEYISQFGRPPTALKRKRESLQETSVHPKPYVSPYAPLDPPNRLASSLPNTPIIQSTPNMIIPAHVARDQTAYNNYIREREPQQNGSARQLQVSLAPKPGFVAINGNGYKSSPAIIQTGPKFKKNREEEYDRDRTESLSPSAQLLDDRLQSPSPQPPSTRKPLPEPTRMTTRNTQKRNPHSNGSAAEPNSSRALDPPGTPFVDSLPRRKQKQILGIISGLQSGIRSCQQQAESMQKQLDLLTTALGIDADDD